MKAKWCPGKTVAKIFWHLSFNWREIPKNLSQETDPNRIETGPAGREDTTLVLETAIPSHYQRRVFFLLYISSTQILQKSKLILCSYVRGSFQKWPPLWSRGNIVTSHADGVGSIPVGSVSWLRIFPRFSLNRKINFRKFGPHSSPVIIWPSYIIQKPYIVSLRTTTISHYSCRTWPSLSDKQQQQWPSESFHENKFLKRKMFM